MFYYIFGIILFIQNLVTYFYFGEDPSTYSMTLPWIFFILGKMESIEKLIKE